MSSIKAVLWDMDGVLIDSERLVQKAFAQVASANNLMDNPEQRYLETIGFNRANTVNWYLSFVDSVERAESFYSAVHDAYVEMAKTELRLKPGVVEALTYVQSCNIPQMVVTSTKTKTATEKMTHFKLLPFFDSIIGGDQVANGKPHPEPYLKGVAHLGQSADQTLVIEDSENGVKSGVAAGCQVLHVPDLIATKESWRAQITDSLATLERFPQWLADR